MTPRTRHLANPEGTTGLGVADWLYQNNKLGNAKIIASLGVGAGYRVLEIGFGNGRAASQVIAQAANV
jgi:hypothetical protein